MKLLLLLGFFLFGLKSQRMKVIEVEADELRQAVPMEVRPAEKKREVEIEIDAAGKVSAVSGKKKLEAFDSTKAAGMKPLDDWMAKLKGDEPPMVAVRVAGEALQGVVIGVLNVMAGQKITEITFADLPEK